MIDAPYLFAEHRDGERSAVQLRHAVAGLADLLARQQVFAAHLRPSRGLLRSRMVVRNGLHGRDRDTFTRGVAVYKRAQVVEGQACRGKSSLGIGLGHALEQQCQARVERHQRPHVDPHTGKRHIGGVFLARDGQAGHRQPVQVTARERGTNELLHRRVAKRSGAGRRRLFRRRDRSLHRAKVDEPRALVVVDEGIAGVDQDIAGLDVAVDNRR